MSKVTLVYNDGTLYHLNNVVYVEEKETMIKIKVSLDDVRRVDNFITETSRGTRYLLIGREHLAGWRDIRRHNSGVGFTTRVRALTKKGAERMKRWAAEGVVSI